MSSRGINFTHSKCRHSFLCGEERTRVDTEKAQYHHFSLTDIVQSQFSEATQKIPHYDTISSSQRLEKTNYERTITGIHCWEFPEDFSVKQFPDGRVVINISFDTNEVVLKFSPDTGYLELMALNAQVSCWSIINSLRSNFECLVQSLFGRVLPCVLWGEDCPLQRRLSGLCRGE